MIRSSWLLFLITGAAWGGDIRFNRDIRPIFTKHCTSCHGGVKEAGNISLIYRDRALGEGKSGERAIVPGKPEESELMRRIVSKDPDEVMPKPKHGPPLVEKEVAIIRQWIAEGAAWEELWSFIPPQEEKPPALQQKDWPKQELDAWVLANLESKGLKPSPEAGKAEWLRRASLDLTGLPPSYEEWAAFRDDNAPDAYEKVVDRLLASPHYGERWAVMWMDLARYSDTKGFERDPARTVWPYRDWLIRAFNSDMPYDQFTMKQLAGDLAANPAPDDFIATAFHRNTMNNSEGGTDDEEYRIAAVMDRINTTWTTWQATTFGCVQCHSHPYDPYPHEDYYRFMAFFDNSEDGDTNDDFPNTKVANDLTRQADATRLEREIDVMRKQINQEALVVAEQLTDFQTWKATSLKASAATGGISQKDDGLFYSSGTNPTNSSYTLTFPGQSFAAIRLDILPVSDDPKEWSGLAAVCGDFHVWLVLPDGQRQQIQFKEVIADAIVGPFDPNEAIRKGGAGFGDYPAQRNPRWCLIVPEQPVQAPEGSQLEVSIFHAIGCNESQPSILKRFRLSFSNNPALQQFVTSPERAQRWAQHGALSEQYRAIPGTMVPVMKERSENARRDTRVFIRGNRSTRDESVQSGIPEIMRPPQKTEGLTRIDMAQWLMSDTNPLTARVMANRLWAECFGIGIVETQEDFGTSGTPPTHPQLLDHLALRLQKQHQWRLKPFLRELVLSATYRQQAKASPELLEKDPRNQWLSRGPRQRLTAEMVRDQSLLVSGLLSRKQFGPPVFPPQPDGIWKSVYSGAKWTTSQGEDRYRRGIYTYSKRTSGYPAFLTFDAPTRDVCSPRRLGSNTPLQALVTLNDPAYMEMAQAYAKRMTAAAADLPAQLMAGYEWLTLQQPSQPMLDALLRLHADAVKEFTAQPAEMQKVATSPEAAALVLVANTMLNLDSALNR